MFFPKDGSFTTECLHLRTIKEIGQFLRGDLGMASEERKNSSELRNLSSEVSFHSSELLFPGSVGNFRLLAEVYQFPWEGLMSAGLLYKFG